MASLSGMKLDGNGDTPHSLTLTKFHHRGAVHPLHLHCSLLLQCWFKR